MSRLAHVAGPTLGPLPWAILQAPEQAGIQQGTASPTETEKLLLGLWVKGSQK